MTVEIALAAVVTDARVLLGHRHPHRRWYPDCWDLVGGHVEPGESAEDAVRRECREEIAIDVVTMRPLEISLRDPHITPHAFLVTSWRGEPTNVAPHEHDALAWFSLHELGGLTLADPSYVEFLSRLLR